MKRLLSAIALLLFASLALAGCCGPLCSLAALPCSTCGTICNAIPTGIMLPLLVQAPVDGDAALVSDQNPTYFEPQSTSSADNPMPF